MFENMILGEADKQEIVFRTDIFRKLSLDAPETTHSIRLNGYKSALLRVNTGTALNVG